MFWDRVAWVYDIFANIINRKVHKKLCTDVAALFLSEDEVLECACGTGMLTVHIAPRCKRIVATDLSENMLKKTRKKCAAFDNVFYEKTDMMNLHYDDDTFDAVLAANVIHLLPEPENAVAEMSRVCRPGGRLIIPTYVATRGGKKAERKAAAKSGDCGEKGASKKLNFFSRAIGKMGAGFQRQFTLDEYRAFFKEMGYEDVEYFVVEGRLPCAVAVVRNHKRK